VLIAAKSKVQFAASRDPFEIVRHGKQQEPTLTEPVRVGHPRACGAIRLRVGGPNIITSWLRLSTGVICAAPSRLARPASTTSFSAELL
jgi:hypothetical protein